VAADGALVLAFVDYDRDGLLDLIVTRYTLIGTLRKTSIAVHIARDIVRTANLINSVPYLAWCSTTMATALSRTSRRLAGIASSPGKALGIAINDFDRDGWPDILVANDSFPQQLFKNNHDGTFSEVALESGLAFDQDGKTFRVHGSGLRRLRQ